MSICIENKQKRAINCYNDETETAIAWSGKKFNISIALEWYSRINKFTVRANSFKTLTVRNESLPKRRCFTNFDSESIGKVE